MLVETTLRIAPCVIARPSGACILGSSMACTSTSVLAEIDDSAIVTHAHPPSVYYEGQHGVFRLSAGSSQRRRWVIALSRRSRRMNPGRRPCPCGPGAVASDNQSDPVVVATLLPESRIHDHQAAALSSSSPSARRAVSGRCRAAALGLALAGGVPALSRCRRRPSSPRAAAPLPSPTSPKAWSMRWSTSRPRRSWSRKRRAACRSCRPGTPFRRSVRGVLQAPARGAERQERRAAAGHAAHSRRSNSLGSGFIIDPSGIVITNNHVIEGANEITVILTDGRKLKAEVIGKDAKVDVAVLKVSSDSAFEVGEFRRQRQDARVGDAVMAVGNPVRARRNGHGWHRLGPQPQHR